MDLKTNYKNYSFYQLLRDLFDFLSLKCNLKVHRNYVFNDDVPLQRKFKSIFVVVIALLILFLISILSTGFFKFIIKIFFIISLIYFIFCLIQSFINHDKRLLYFINKNLFLLVRNNRYFNSEVLSQGNKIITYRPTIEYWIDNNLYIKIRLDGGRNQKDYFDLEDKLFHLFQMRILNKFIENGYITYVLSFSNFLYFSYGKEIEGNLIKECSDDCISFSDELVWNFRKQPHALVTGITGGGKTYLLYFIIRNLVSYNCDVKILDPKMADLDYLKNILDSSNVASSIGNIIRILRESSEIINSRNLEFQERADYMQGKDYKDYGYKPIFIIFDEVTAFFASCDSKQSKEANGYLQEIIMKGRSAGVFMVLTTQRADADIISGKIRDQLGLRVSMGQLSPDGYVMTFGNEYRDLRLTNRSIVKENSYSGVGFIYILGKTTTPQEFYAPIFKEGYDFFEDIKKLKLR